MSKTLRVRLNTGGNPQVQIDPIILGERKLKWRAKKGTTKFDFVGISGLPGSFTTTKQTATRISVTNGMLTGDYEYTVAVEAGGVTYTSTATVPPASGGRPVIRNID